MKYITVQYANSGNPEVWGPAMWFSLHNGALRYPKKASPVWCERMKYFILGIPVMVPCEKCADHATTYIESKYNELNKIVSDKDNLFEFFWEFHNFVNTRLGKRHILLKEAYELYSSNTNVTTLNYHKS